MQVRQDVNGQTFLRADASKGSSSIVLNTEVSAATCMP